MTWPSKSWHEWNCSLLFSKIKHAEQVVFMAVRWLFVDVRYQGQWCVGIKAPVFLFFERNGVKTWQIFLVKTSDVDIFILLKQNRHCCSYGQRQWMVPNYRDSRWVNHFEFRHPLVFRLHTKRYVHYYIQYAGNWFCWSYYAGCRTDADCNIQMPLGPAVRSECSLKYGSLVPGDAQNLSNGPEEDLFPSLLNWLKWGKMFTAHGNLDFFVLFNSVFSLLPRPLMNHDRLEVYLHLSWHSLLPWRVFLSGRTQKHILEVVFARKSLFQHVFNQGEQVMVFVYAILVGVAVTVSAVLKVASKAL